MRNDWSQLRGEQSRAVPQRGKNLRFEHTKATDRLAKFKPEEMLEFRRKAVHYLKLYNAMKGLREIAEDRNKNWEVALRKLAAHVVQNTSKGRKVMNVEGMGIGPLVGEAMERIGAQLIDPALDHEEPDAIATPSVGGGPEARSASQA